MHIVIIGAGVLGASAAWHAARSGARVTVFDPRLDGRATAAGAGIVCPWVSGLEDAAFYRLYVGGGEYYPWLTQALAEDGESDLGYRCSGAMLVADDAAELAGLERFALGRRRESPAMGTISRLSPAEARGLFPPLHADLGAVRISGGARVDGRRLAAALLRAAEAHRAEVVAEAAEPWVERGRARGVRVAGRSVEADRVIVAAGAWADRVLCGVGERLGVQPQRGQIVHLRLERTETEAWPVILPAGSHYIVPFDGGRVVVGATRESGVGFDYRVTAVGQAQVLFEALQVAPGLGGATLLETRVGFRPLLPRPVLGWVPGVAGLAVGNGLGAAGLTIGPFGGRLLADLVLERENAMDLAPFGPRRAGEVGQEPEALR